MQEKNTTNAAFSKRIKALMERKGLTEKDLCKKKKSSQSELSAWFRERGEPSVGVLFALSEALEVSVSELWLGKPENTEEVAIKGGNSFSERLQAVMREKALTQADLCKLTDIPKCSMSHYVNGTQQPRTGKLVCISRALGVNAEWLQHGEGKSEQNEQEITNSIQWLEIKRLRKENERLQKENEQLKELLQGHDSTTEAAVLRVKAQRAREEVGKLSSTVVESVNVLSKTLFSFRLGQAIVAKGLKQKSLAEYVGVTEITLSRYKKGTQVPNEATLLLLADALGVSVEWLRGEEEERTSVGLAEAATLKEISQEEARAWKKRALMSEERLKRLEVILKELFAFAKIGE